MTTTGSNTVARSVASVVTTNASPAITAPAGSFSKTRDLGAPISGTGIPAGATLLAVASTTAATLSANAGASGTVTATVGPRRESAVGHTGWIPEVDSRETDYTFASNIAGTAPLDRLTDSVTRSTQYVEH